MSPVIQSVVVLLVLAATWSDFRTRRIPNALTVAGAILGFGLHFWEVGFAGALMSLEGIAVGLGLFGAFFLTRGMGAGDVKLFAAIGALVGPQPLMLIFVFTGLLGAIAALAMMVW